MNQTRTWLETNEKQLAEIARASGTVPWLVHLAAVLVADGLTDAQIIDQCAALRTRLHSADGFPAGLRRALPEIRELASDLGVGASEGGDDGQQRSRERGAVRERAWRPRAGSRARAG